MNIQEVMPSAYYGGLFNDCPVCPAFSACGGAKTAPCGCAWTMSSGRRHRCSECPIICRERQEVGPDGIGYHFRNHLASGMRLETLSISQEEKGLFPLYVPLFTYFNTGKELPLRWAAADIATLFKRRTGLKTLLKTTFNTEYMGRRYLSVNKGCELWAVLNGKDSSLESFWGMGNTERLETFKHLKKLGFAIGTGATFSVSDMTHLNTAMPQSHNVAMLARHNQVLQELSTAGLYSVPNLYWRDGEMVDIARWTNWLIENPHIQSVSRDFTSTKNLTTNLSKLNELMRLLEITGRSFHIMIVGTGVVTAPTVLKVIAQKGHVGTIISSSPIFDAAKCAIKYEVHGEKILRIKDYDTPRSELIVNNMRIFELYLQDIVLRETGQRQFLRNIA